MSSTLAVPMIQVHEVEVSEFEQRGPTNGRSVRAPVCGSTGPEPRSVPDYTQNMYQGDYGVGHTGRAGSFPISKSGKKGENHAPKTNGAPPQQRLRMYIPPTNFGAVEPGCVYRSSYPELTNYNFILSLGIKTIITLVPEPLSPIYSDFIRENNIQHHQTHVPANKDGVIKMTPRLIASVLAVVMNRAHHPILVHCNRGKHRTGCIVACFRKTQRRPTEYALSEYRDYANPKCRPDDERFIKEFDPSVVTAFAQSQGWLATPPPEPIGKVACVPLEVQRDAIMEAVWTRLPSPSPSEGSSEDPETQEPKWDEHIVEDAIVEDAIVEEANSC